MKVTNTSGVVMHVRGIDGVRPIAAGKTANIEFTDEQLERARGRTFLTIEEVPQTEAAPKPAGKKKADGDKPAPVIDEGA